MNLIAKAAGVYLNSLAYINRAQCGAMGYKLCSYPSRVKLTTFQQQYLNAAKSGELTLGQFRLQTYRWGNGSKHVVFIHGWQSHSFRWKPYIESLSFDDYTIHAMDAPGHGLSDGNLLNAPLYSASIELFLNALGPVDTVVAHSVGAFSLLHALHHHPALQISKMIIMAAPTEATYFMDFCKQYLGLSDKALALIQAKFELEFKEPLSEFSARKFVSTISTPSLIIHDKEDVETPYQDILSVHQSWTSSTLLTTKGLGHKLKSMDVIQAVKSFIQLNESMAYPNIRHIPKSEIGILPA